VRRTFGWWPAWRARRRMTAQGLTTTRSTPQRCDHHEHEHASVLLLPQSALSFALRSPQCHVRGDREPSQAKSGCSYAVSSNDRHACQCQCQCQCDPPCLGHAGTCAQGDCGKVSCAVCLRRWALRQDSSPTTDAAGPTGCGHIRVHAQWRGTYSGEYEPVRFKLGGRPFLSARLNVKTAGSERKRPQI
jgi:hypothetical protein